MKEKIRGYLPPADSDEEKALRQKTTGFILHNARESKGLSLNALSRRVEVDPSYIFRIERGEVPASVGILNSIADTLNYSRFEFLEASGHIGIGEDVSSEEREEFKHAIDSRKLIIK